MTWDLSREAFALHSATLVESVRRDQPGFVSDDMIVPEEAVLAAVELQAVGLWERTPGGYVVTEPDLVQLVVELRAESQRTTPGDAARRALRAQR